MTTALTDLEVRKAAQALRQCWVLGNEYLQEAAPWTAIKTDPDRAAIIVRTALALVGLYARLSRPFIPFAAGTIAAAVGEGDRLDRWPDAADVGALLAGFGAGRGIRTPEVLFRKIEDAQLAEWSERFGGTPADAD